MGQFKKDTFKIFLSAGEASGDLHGSKLVTSILALHSATEVTCMGGPMLEASGATVLVDNRDVSVVGLSEVVRHLSSIRKAWKKIKTHLTQDRPDIVILIDFPDFNFLLARLAKKLSIKVIYYISPQVWAWREGRVKAIKRLVDKMIVILPFEPAYYRKHGVQVYYLGHPLLDALKDIPPRDIARDRYGYGPSDLVLGLLPGSRHSEIRSLLPLLLSAAAIVKGEIPGLRLVLPVAPSLESDHIREEIRTHGIPVMVVKDDTHRVMRACDLILTASGTVTLEAAILGTPMIITYRVSGLTYILGRSLIKVDHVGLPNLIAGRRIVPEILQRDATPEAIAAEALKYLRNQNLLKLQSDDLATVRKKLGTPPVSERVAEIVLQDKAPAAGPTLRKDSEALFKIKGSKPPAYLFYNMLLPAIWPFLFFYYFMRAETDGKYRDNYRARMGVTFPVFRAEGRKVWLHALSVGEVQSMIPFVKALKEITPALELIVSTTTETGQAIARKLLAGFTRTIFYLPHDFPWVVEYLVENLKPEFFITVETDIWPNLMRSLWRHQIPAFLINGRISENSFRRWKRLRAFFGPPLDGFDKIFAQSLEDANRYVALGADSDRVEVVGNIKFDSSGQRMTEGELSQLRDNAAIDEERPVWIAGSTHPGEEEGLLRVHNAVRRSCGDALLILAPRQVSRSHELLSLCGSHGFKAARRSRNQRADNCDVYILDTLGELKNFYALAKVAFIGGSMVPFGGHNPLEAITHGKPSFWGPHLFNFREIESLLLKTSFCRMVTSEREIELLLLRWLKDEAFQAESQEIAGDLVSSFAGASRRIAHIISRKVG